MRYLPLYFLPTMLLALLVVPARAADEAAARKVVEQFFAVYAQKDLDGLMALWSEQAPDYKSRQQTLQRIFQQTDALRLRELTIVNTIVTNDAAQVRVHVELAGNDKRHGKPHPDLGRFDRVLELVREKGVWKVWRYVPTEVVFLDRLLAAGGQPAREQLYQQEKDLVTIQLVIEATRLCRARADHGKFDEALRFNALAFEIAEQLADDAARARCHYSQGYVRFARSAFREALADYERALALFRAARNREWEADMLNNLGVVLLALDRYDDALRHFQDSLKIQRELGKRTSAAATLMNLGIIHDFRGRYDEALQCYQEALKLARELEDREDEATILVNLGNVYLERGRYDDALQCYEKCLQIKREVGDRIGEAITLNNIGSAYVSQGRFDEALRCYQASLTINRELGNRKGEISTLLGMGTVYQDRGLYEEALRTFQDGLKRARELRTRALEAKARNGIGEVFRFRARYDDALEQFQLSLQLKGELGDRTGEASARNNIGNVLRSRGQFSEALRLFQENLQLVRERGLRSAEAVTLGNIGIVYQSMGHYAEALTHHQDSLKIARDLGARAKEAVALGSIGSVYHSTAQFPEAERYQLESLKLIRELGYRAREIEARRDLGLVYRAAGRDQDAVQEFQASLQLARERGERVMEASVLNNLALVYESQGQHLPAIESHQAALKIYRELSNRAGEALTLGNLGIAYVSSERYADALAAYEAGLKLAEDLGMPETALTCFWGIGNVCYNQGRWTEAAGAYQKAIANIEVVRGGAREQSMQTSFLARHSWAYFGLTRSLLELGRSEEAFAVSEQSKARALVDVLQAGKVEVCKSMSTEQRQEEGRFQNRINVLAAKLEELNTRQSDPARQHALASQLKQAHQHYDDFRRTLYLRHPDVQTRRAEFAPATLVDLNRGLFARDPQVVVLSYLVAADQTLLFTLTRGDKADGPAALSVQPLPVGSKALAAEVTRFRGLCEKPARFAPTGEADGSGRLYGWLLAPAARALEGKTHLVIVPDGSLHALPFQALRDPEGKYLLECCSLSYAPSATALLAMSKLADRRRASGGAVATGLLAVGQSSFGGRHRDLPTAGGEAAAAARSWWSGPLLLALTPPPAGMTVAAAGMRAFGGPAVVLDGARLGREQVRDGLGKARYVHLATHGLVNEAAPMYSGIVVGQDSGALEARELLDLELHTELVVLSACDTALGQQVSGEGILGLTWALFVAGSTSNVVTQWQANDPTTARLMEDFWRGLAAGAGKAEALRRAQLRLLNDSRHRHPYFWALFTLVGDWS